MLIFWINKNMAIIEIGLMMFANHRGLNLLESTTQKTCTNIPSLTFLAYTAAVRVTTKYSTTDNRVSQRQNFTRYNNNHLDHKLETFSKRVRNASICPPFRASFRASFRRLCLDISVDVSFLLTRYISQANRTGIIERLF
jgi:hypothetical protein